VERKGEEGETYGGDVADHGELAVGDLEGLEVDWKGVSVVIVVEGVGVEDCSPKLGILLVR
jgi:hypothetical protein